MPMTAATSESDALKLPSDVMEMGDDPIFCATWCLKFINALSNARTSTEGHLGLVHRRSTWTGGLRPVGEKKSGKKTV